MYIVQAQVVKVNQNGSSTTFQVPTFFLSRQVQGITDKEHAQQIAKEIVNSTKDPNIIVNLFVSQTD